MGIPQFNLPVTGTDPKMATKEALEAAVQVVVDQLYSLLSGAVADLEFEGAWDASGGTFPTPASGKGGYYVVSVAGTVDSVSFAVGDWLVALVATPSTTTYAANWLNIPYSAGAVTAFADTAALLASTDIVVGKSYTVADGYNNGPEWFTIVAAGTYTTGATVLTCSGISGQAVSLRQSFKTRAEMLADTRPYGFWEASPASSVATQFSVGHRRYDFALSGASDNDDATAGGVKLYRETRQDVTVTVGSGGDFSTVNDAIEFLSGQERSYDSGDVTAEIQLLTGFVWAEQVLIYDLDLSWIEITSVDAEVTVTRSALVTAFTSTSATYPIIGVHNGNGPVVKVLFNMDATGTATGRHGFTITDGGFIKIDGGFGCKNAGDIGLLVNRQSRAAAHQAVFPDAGVAGVWVLRDSRADVALTDVSGAGTYGLIAQRNSTIESPSGTNADGCGTNAVYATGLARINCQDIIATNAGGDAIWVSNAEVNARQANASGATLSGVRADEGATVNFLLGNASGAGVDGITCLKGSRVNARQANCNSCTGDGIYATEQGQVVAVSATAVGCGAHGVRAEFGSEIIAYLLTATGCDIGAYAANGSHIFARQADLSGATGAYGARCNVGATLNVRSANCQQGGSPASTDISLSLGGLIYASAATGGLSQTANTLTVNGIIFQ